jgi:glycosyltransferase 2 family protein
LNFKRFFQSKSAWLGFTISLFALYWVFKKLNWSQFFTELTQLDLGFGLLAGLFFLTTFVFRTWRWQILLGSDLEPPSVMRILLLGYFANNLLPARLGEFVRAFVIEKKFGLRKTRTLATILVERLSDGLSLLFILAGVMVCAAFKWVPELPLWLYQGGAIALAGFGGVFLVTLMLAINPQFELFLEQQLPKILPAKLSHKITDITAGFLTGITALKSPGRILLVYGLSLVVWGLETSTYAALGAAFHLSIPLIAYAVTMVIVNLGTIIPSAPGFVGTFQVFCVLSLGAFGVSEPQGVNYGLVLNIGEYLLVTGLGILALLGEQIKLTDVIDPDKQQQTTTVTSHG